MKITDLFKEKVAISFFSALFILIFTSSCIALQNDVKNIPVISPPPLSPVIKYKMSAKKASPNKQMYKGFNRHIAGQIDIINDGFIQNNISQNN